MVSVGGVHYKATCNCDGSFASGVAGGVAVCNPNRANVLGARVGTGGMSLAEIRQLYGQPRNVAFASTVDQGFQCMDDRLTRASFAAPGGELGMFITTLSNTPTGRVDGAMMTALLNDYLSQIPPSRQFTHCTDEGAIERLENSAQMEGLDLVRGYQRRFE
eukprot:GHVU01140194.1.p1 GENE.GHVU01140194.1~~GHVU01140194.1.p1  ORF type:complete len:161 (+),score=14.29 GHVU01140194.1:698-1180(+)